MKACPYCMKEIDDEAAKCKHCGGWLVDEADFKQKKLDQEKAVQKILGDEQKPEMKDYGENTEYFSLSNTKLVLMCVLTLGFYDLYWFYRNWKAVKLQEQKKISPFWRAFFAIIFCYSLFKRALVSARSKGYQSKATPEVLAAAYIVLNVVANRVDVLWWAGLFSFVPILIAANAIRYSNVKLDGNLKEHKGLNGPEIAFLVIGLLLWALIALGQFLPEEEYPGDEQAFHGVSDAAPVRAT